MSRTTSWILAALFIIFFLPELLLWGTVDHFQTPLRAYKGDTAHYVAVLSSAEYSGFPDGHSYFKEDATGPSRFWLFETLAGMVGYLNPFGIVWTVALLRLLVAVSSYFLIQKIAERLGVAAAHATVGAFVFVTLYGVIAFTGYGLANWFYPGLLLSLLCVVVGFLRPTFDDKTLGLFSLALVPLCFHPAYFGLGTVALGLLWIYLFFHEKNKTQVVRYCLLWLGSAVALFLFFFFSNILQSAATHDTLVRMALIPTRVIVHPIISLCFLFLFGVTQFFRKGTHAKSWIVLSAFIVAAFLCMNSYLVTGNYLVNDHYVVIEDLLAVLTCLLFFKEPEAGKKNGMRYFLGTVGVIAAVAALLSTLNYLDFRLGFYIRWVPAQAAYFLLAFSLLSPWFSRTVRQLFTRRAGWLLCVAAFSLSALLVWKDVRNNHLLDHVEIQQYRPLFELLSRYPANEVVLADTTLSYLMPIYTPHKVYWSHIGFGQTTTNNELLYRWENARLIFPDDPNLSGGAAAVSILGAIDRCRDWKREQYLLFLSSHGFPGSYKEICGINNARTAAVPVLEKEANVYAAKIEAEHRWQPLFAADILVVTPGEVLRIPSWILETYFVRDARVGEFQIYRRK